MMTNNLTRKCSIRALAVLVVVGAVGIGYAEIPGASGVISGCYDPRESGEFRIIDAEAGAKCHRSEKLLTFNQTGPQGPKGDKGDPGTNGTNGVNGADGKPGLPGPAGISTVTFAFGVPDTAISPNPDEFTKVASKNLPAGSWAVVATATIESPIAFNGDLTSDTACELRNGANFIGGARDRRVTLDGSISKVSLSMNGGAQIPPGGGEVSLWCSLQDANGDLLGAQMMLMQVGGFS